MAGRVAQWLSRGEKSLRNQASLRLLLVGLIASVLLFVFGALSFQLLNKRELALRHEQVRQYYAETLPALETAQQQAVAQLVARLEFARILETRDDSRWPMLTSWLNAQWALNDFSNLLILDRDGRVLYGYGSEAETLRQRAAEAAAWLYVPQYRQFYAVYRLPLWLGAQGQGRLVVFKTLSNSLMRTLAIPQTRLQLTYQGQVMASSEDDWEPDPAYPDADLRVAIPWVEARPGDSAPPLLVAWRGGKDLYPFSQFVLRPVIASAVILGLLWVGLGRWLSQTTRRIAALERGARHYAEGHGGEALDTALAPALSRDDEIRKTAQAFEHLVHTVEARDQEQRSYLETLALLEEAVIEFDAGGTLLRASPGWNKLTGNDDSLGRSVQDFILAEDAPLLHTQLAHLAKGEGHVATLRLRLRPKTGQTHESWVEVRLMASAAAQSREAFIRGVLRDVTQTYLHEQQITHMALHDSLTGLPNRVLLEDRFKIALRLASRNEGKVGVCFIDLDHFKTVNDTLGHKAGDRLLVSFAERLRGSLRAGDTLARWGGDEFVLLLPEMAQEADVRQVADKVIAALQVPLDLDGSDIRVTFSMGAAVYPLDGNDVETLFSHADRAMFYAKSQGRNQVCFFRDMASKDRGKVDLYIQSRLAEAIDQHLIQTWFQPIVDARTGRCIAVEVLARWQDSEHGWISPATFIPMAENLGLIHILGHQILLDSLDALQHLQPQGFHPQMAVNISKRQLFVEDFAEQLAAEVVRRGLKPDHLMLEVTESLALHDVERGADRVQELRKAGFLIAIDDFGTGYSSLSQLHEMNATELKIDISFVRRLHESAGRSMVQAIVNMAQALGLKTVAEGVETADAAATLSEMGVNCLQGYLFAKPMPLAQLEIWLQENAAACGAGEGARATVSGMGR